MSPSSKQSKIFCRRFRARAGTRTISKLILQESELPIVLWAGNDVGGFYRRFGFTSVSEEAEDWLEKNKFI